MKKAIFTILFFLGFMFVSLNYAKADVPAYVCSSDASYAPGDVIRCGLLPNFCTGCDLYNHVVNCVANSEGRLPTTIDYSTCTYVEDLLHEKDSSICAEEASCKPPPPTCQTITCGTNSGAGGTCTYPGTIDPKISGCTATCPDGSQVPGYSVSVCQTDNCYYNNCTCYPILCQSTPPATPAPTITPALVCPVPPAVTNIRVECPYCL